MAIRLDLPGPDDLPVTEGPPEQDEPEGQELGGPHPDTIPPAVHELAKVNLGTLLVARAMPVVTGDRAIAAMQALLNTGESPAGSNCNAITRRCGLGCCAWCDETIWTAWFAAGFNDGSGHVQMPGVATDYWFGDAYVPNTWRHFQAAGRASAKPVPGAAGVHFWGGGEGNSHIVMFVQDYGNGTLLNMEGNHNNVCEYVRRPVNDSTRAGYCIPVFSSVPAPTPTPPAQEEENMTYFHYTGQLHAVFVNSAGQLCHFWADPGDKGWHSEIRSSGNVPGATVAVDTSFAGQLHFLTPRPNGAMQHDWYDDKGWHAEAIPAPTPKP